jgi:acyl-CoA synthetase (NDP forming)
MRNFFEPESVAVIGASAHHEKGGYQLVSNLKDRFNHRLYPVNPDSPEVCGVPAFRGIGEVPEIPDLVIIFVNAEAVPHVLEECGQKRVRSVMIQSAGFSETGPRGLGLQERCVSIARKHGIRVWGPNCMGVVDAHSGLVASFMKTDIWRGRLRPGNVSLIVQSGMLSAGFLVQVLSEGYFGLSKACSIGNRCDVNECDILEYLAQDSTTDIIVLYLESISDVPRFRDTITRLSRPVVLLKGGTSIEGARAAKSHTGSLAGNAMLAEGFFKQMRIHRAWDFMEMFDLARSLALWQRKERGRSMAVVTFSGAAGIVASDHLARYGLTLAPLSEKTLTSLHDIFPAWMEPQNPVDIWPAVERVGRQKAYRLTLECLVNDPRVDGIFVHLYVDPEIVEDITFSLEPLQKSRKPAAVWVIGDTRCFRTLRDRAEPMGVPVFTEVGRAARAFGLMTEHLG